MAQSKDKHIYNLRKVDKLAVMPKIWWFVANLANKVREPGFKVQQVNFVVLGVDEGQTINYGGTSRQICLLESLKKLDIDISL